MLFIVTGCNNINAANIKKVADQFEKLNLKKYGYEYINIDDCWCTSRSNVTGELVPDPKAFPDGMKAVALVSHDGGRAWPEYVDLLGDYANGLVFFEISFVQLDDGRLVVVGWVFHEESGTSRPNLFAVADASLQFGLESA